MSDLASAFAKSRQKVSGRTAPVSGNMIIRPTEFGEKTFKGEILTGQNAGTNIEVAYGAGKNGQAEYTKKSKKTYVDIDAGGTVQAEGVKPGKDGIYDARWVLTFNGKPENTDSKKQIVTPGAVCNFVSTTFRDKEDRPVMRMNQLVMDDAAHVTALDDLKSAIREAFETEGAATMFGVSNGTPLQVPFYQGGKTIDGKWQSYEAAESVELQFEALGDSVNEVEKVLADGGFTVVPTRGFRVGSVTAENIELEIEEASEAGRRPKFTTIDPGQFKTPSIGTRLQMTLGVTGENAISKEDASKLKSAFDGYADKTESATLAKEGWRGLSDDTMRKFFSSMGVDLKQHPETAWSTQALLEDRYGDMERGFIIKSFQTGKIANPYPPVEAFKEVRDDYFIEMKDAVEGALQGLRVEAGAGKKVEEKMEATTAAEDLPVNDDDDELGKFLDGVTSEDMSLED